MSSLSSSSQLFLPPGTPFPINVVKIQAKTSDSVQRGSPLLTYSFTSRPSEPGGRTQVLFGIWDCPVDGTIERWCVKERDVITSEDKAVVYVSEPCKHGVQMGGLCALCGKDMTQSDYTGFSNEARASIQMTHSANGPKVSLEEAQRIERETAMHLFSTRKLSLIVDLDQTIVHATVDPTVGDWIAEGEAWEARQGASSEAESDSDQSSQGEDDQVNPNWEALKDVKKFRLSPESFGLPPSPDGRRAKGKEKAVETQGCLYYVKPRPGCHDFLSSVATKYEMHVYTMGTRAYAEEVCKAIDPDAKFFGGRILSRDESGSLTQKSLQRLFPVDTSMVVIIDDRADVWEWSPNLVKVIPYDFFVGIGDINSTFLPKLDASTSGMPQMSPTPLGRQPPAVSGSTLSTSAPGPSSRPQPKNMSRKEILQKEMIARNSLALEAQVEERPLAKLQEELQEAANGQLASDTSMSDTASGQSENSSKTSDAPGEKHHRKALLKNDDTELQRVKRLLDAIHEQFFEAYDNRAPDKERTKFVNKAQPSSSVLYDIRIIIPGLRFQTFDGLHILFSSVIPLDARPESTDIWNLAEAFGATCYTELTREVTHLVAAKRGTAKIDQARKRDESPYLMDEPLSSSATAPDTASSPAPPDAQQISSDPEPDADDWDVEPGSGNGGSGAAATGMAAAQGSGTMYEEELDDLKRISEQSQSLELSLSWEDADEELREFLASGDEEDEDEDEEGDGNGDDGDGASSKDMGHTSESARKNDQRLGGETGSVDGGSAPSSPRTRRKRLRSLTPSEAGLNASDDDLLRSPLSKRKKLAKDRQNASKLKESISPEEFAPPTVPSPREEDEEEDEEDDESIFGDGFEDDFLARELEEEMG
ncbi:hypothetical protein F5148DRAFT_1279614 [Russula earlei]|uniref:Uncharacterized protein n=1 Tax=Russula earlei TaxID=71964 RepID=A0ACC0UN23_9AGAM|nr:hypothetical protein F5148DRAFT_1279614 [Russula earlei]